jgi:hypothetical protein
LEEVTKTGDGGGRIRMERQVDDTERKRVGWEWKERRKRGRFNSWKPVL